MVNASVQELYGTLASTYQDYNVKQQTFTLIGGDPPGNTLAVGPGTQFSDFYLLRGVWFQANPGPGVRWVPLLRLASLLERHVYLGPNVSLYYGSVPSAFNLLGGNLEVLPPQSSAGVYMLTYVPTMPLLVGPNDDIAPYWLSTNGWDEFVVLGVAAKALIKEESIESANLLLQMQNGVRERILREAAPRDDNQPGQIADIQRARAWGLNGWNERGGGGWW